MGVIIRKNERSWAIDIISEIRTMLNGMNIKIKSAGGESTLSVNKKSMFPDVLITDEALLKDAARKAAALGLNSFVIWNFTYGKLYVKNPEGTFEEAKVWNGTDHIKSREDVTTYKIEWLPKVLLLR